MDINEITKLKK